MFVLKKNTYIYISILLRAYHLASTVLMLYSAMSDVNPTTALQSRYYYSLPAKKSRPQGEMNCSPIK